MGYDADGVFLGFFKVESRKILYSNNNIGSVAFVVFIRADNGFFLRSRRIPARGRPAVSVCGFRRRSGSCTAPPPFRQVVSRANAMKAGRILPIIAARRSCRCTVVGRSIPDGLNGRKRAFRQFATGENVSMPCIIAQTPKRESPLWPAGIRASASCLTVP